MEKSELNRKRKRVETDECEDDSKENFQPFSEKQLPGILKQNPRTSDGLSGPHTQTRVILSRSEENTHKSTGSEDEWDYTGSSQRTKKSKQRDPSSTVMPDHILTSSAARPSDILKSFARDENFGTINQTKPHKCPICSKLCTRKNYLANHMKSHKGTQKTDLITVGVTQEENVVESYRCLICFRSFSRLNYLKNHTRLSHDKNQHASNKSQKSLSVQRKLKLLGTTLTNIRLFECAFCQKSFGQIQHRDNHLLTHLREKHYNCHICEKSFVQKSNLSTHFKIHMREMSKSENFDSKIRTGVKVPALAVEKSQKTENMDLNGQQTGEELFACEKSQESHNFDSNVHPIGEKRHKCTSCPKSFRKLAQLRIHVRVHTGERPYKCLQCPKAYTQPNNLKIHSVTHTGEKPYKCKYCLKLFGHISKLTRHLKTHREKKLESVSQ